MPVSMGNPAGCGTTSGTAAIPQQAGGPSGSAGGTESAASHPTGLVLLVIGDGPDGAVGVPQLLDTAAGQLPEGERVRVRTARNLTEAERLLTHDVHCILLDLAPSGESDSPLDTLRQVLRMAPTHAVLVLTAEADTAWAAEAVRVGAQDHLCRDELDGRLLHRAVRYAVERKRADLAQRQLTESRLHAQENARLERGLLPTPLLGGSALRFAARYRPGRSRALLGGDFYDTVRTSDGTVHAMIGDVSGHGPDEAALGVELRIAWRALTFAGLCGDELLGTLQRVLEHERASEEIFATLCTVDIAPDGRRAGLCLAGHPAPLVAQPGGSPRLLPHRQGGPALGLLPHARWPRLEVELGGSWSLMMYTDGLIEGRAGVREPASERPVHDGVPEGPTAPARLGLDPARDEPGRAWDAWDVHKTPEPVTERSRGGEPERWGTPELLPEARDAERDVRRDAERVRPDVRRDVHRDVRRDVHRAERSVRLGQEGMLGIVATRMAEGLRGETLLDAVLAQARALNGGELTDDVAVLLLDRGVLP